MSGYATTSKLGLKKPLTGADDDQWGTHWNQNADVLDQAVGNGAGRFMTVEDFGAKGDGSADDSDAFDAYAAYLRARITSGQTPNAWVLGFGRVYYVTRSIDCTGFSHTRFDGNHSRIASADLTHPAMDFLNSSYCTVSNLRIAAGQQASPALVGITYGMARESPGASNMAFENIEIDGYFSRAAMQNCESEINLLVNVILTNRYTSGTLGSSYCFIADGMRSWDLNSRYVTDTRTRNLASSFLALDIIGCNFDHEGDGAAIWEGGGGGSHHYRGGYMKVSAPTHIVKFVTANALSDPVDVAYGGHFRDFIWDVHSEFNPSCTFLISGNRADALFPGMRVREVNVMLDPAGFMFRIDGTSGVTRVLLEDADLFVPQWWRSGSKLFDNPAKYIMTGRIMMNNDSIAAWQAPAGGYVEFVTDTTRSALVGGFYGTIMDQNGADILAASVNTGSLIAAGAEVFLRGDKGLGLRWNAGANRFEFEIGGTPVAAFDTSGRLLNNGTQVVGFHITGWGAATGGSKAAFNAGTATLPQTAAAVAQLIADLTAHGLIGT